MQDTSSKADKTSSSQSATAPYFSQHAASEQGAWPESRGKRRALSQTAARVLIASSVFAFALGCSGSKSTEAQSVDSQKSSRVADVSLVGYSKDAESIADVVESVLPSVVSVTSTKQARAQNPHDFFFGRQGGERQSKGLGSGVVLSADGLIVTNNHVIDGADTVSVTTNDEHEYEAKVIGADPKSDVAVLQLQGDVTGLVPIKVGNSGALRLGEVVLAVGNPFGVGQTVTMGIVSATGRSDMGIVDYENFIQTDAAINPGNSGGALINMRGELVGINTAILSRSGGSMGIGFAIPTSMASPIVEALRTSGTVTRGWLGVRIQELDGDLKDALKLGASDGVLIADVEAKGPADRGGLQSGDVVTHVGDSPVSSAGQFRNLIASAGAESKVKLSVLRDGKKKSLSVELGVLPTEQEAPHIGSVQSEEQGAKVEGLSLRTLDDNLRSRLQVPAETKGAVIAQVRPGSAEAAAELRMGDVIVEINREPVQNAKEAQKKYSAAKGAKLLKILRRGATAYVVVK